MRTLILVLFVIVMATLAVAGASDASPMWCWTTEDSVLSCTDTEKNIPARYKDQAEVVETENLATERITPHSTAGHADELTARLARLRQVNAPAPKPVRECEGHVTVTSDRIQVGEYNSRVFIVKNECGETVSVTPFYPDVQINR